MARPTLHGRSPRQQQQRSGPTPPSHHRTAHTAAQNHPPDQAAGSHCDWPQTAKQAPWTAASMPNHAVQPAPHPDVPESSGAAASLGCRQRLQCRPDRHLPRSSRVPARQRRVQTIDHHLPCQTTRPPAAPRPRHRSGRPPAERRWAGNAGSQIHYPRRPSPASSHWPSHWPSHPALRRRSSQHPRRWRHVHLNLHIGHRSGSCQRRTCV
jgi:hypothetical protein